MVGDQLPRDTAFARPRGMGHRSFSVLFQRRRRFGVGGRIDLIQTERHRIYLRVWVRWIKDFSYKFIIAKNSFLSSVPRKIKVPDKIFYKFSNIPLPQSPIFGAAVDILKVERHTEGGCVYGIRFFSRSSVRPAPARASASRRMVFTASPRTKRSKGACCRCRGKTCLQITKTAYRAKNSVDGFQLRQRESNTRWGSQSPLPYRLAMAHCRILF